MGDMYKEILQAINELENKKGVRELQGNERTDLTERIQAIFVKGNPTWWWTSLRYGPILMDDEGNSSSYLKIADFLPDDKYYFIAALGRFHIFEAPLSEIIEIIGNCSFFEYYIVDMPLTTL